MLLYGLAIALVIASASQSRSPAPGGDGWSNGVHINGLIRNALTGNGIKFNGAALGHGFTIEAIQLAARASR